MNTQEDILNMIATEAVEQEPPSILDQLTAANKRIEELEKLNSEAKEALILKQKQLDVVHKFSQHEKDELRFQLDEAINKPPYVVTYPDYEMMCDL